LREGIPFANAAPTSRPMCRRCSSSRPAPTPRRRQRHEDRPDADQDDHRAGLKARLLGVRGWYSTNILGNRDGEVLDDPESFKTKEESKKSALDYIFQPHLYPDLYKDLCHVVRINYYPPRGDNKEGWDNIDLIGWLGYPMQLKINFLCRDSILAAPIVARLGAVPRSCEARRHVGHPGVALVLLQSADACTRGLSRARSVHSAHEAEEHASSHAGRRADHSPGTRVLRLTPRRRLGVIPSEG
jgi:hypothetical protein